MSHPGYHEQDGCHNCALVFVRRDYDDESTYYCAKDAPPRPPCGSVLMGEWVGMRCPKDERDRQSATWDSWSAGREVQPWGRCEAWRAKVPPSGEEETGK